MIAKLRAYVTGRGTGTVVHECRQCGETLSADAEGCPYCGPGADVVSYEI